jgi:hypothetical protein
LTKALLSAGVIVATGSAALALPSVAPRDAIAPAQPVVKVCSGRWYGRRRC